MILTNSLIKLDATAFQAECTKAELVPDQSVQVTKTLSPGVQVADADEETWTLELEFLQGGALETFLMTNSGLAVDFEYARVNIATKVKYSGEVMCVAPSSIGGSQGEQPKATVKLAVTGAIIPGVVA